MKRGKSKVSYNNYHLLNDYVSFTLNVLFSFNPIRLSILIFIFRGETWKG